MPGAFEAALRAAGPRALPPPRRRLPPVRRRAAAVTANLRAARAEGHARALAPGEPRPKSILGQLTETVANLPAGIAGLAQDIAVTGTAPLRIPYDALRGDLGRGMDVGPKYLPFVHETGQSFKRTGHRAGQGILSLAPGGMKPTDTEYAKASREGGIVGAVLEDVGNVAIIGTVASGGTTAAAGRAGARAATDRAAARALTDAATTRVAETVATRAGPRQVVRDAVSTGRVFEAGPSGTRVRYTAKGADEAIARAAESTAKAERLGRVSRQLTGASRTLDKAADAPARIFTVPARAVARRAGPRLGPLVERAGGITIGDRSLRQRATERAANRAGVEQFEQEILTPVREETLHEQRQIGLAQRPANDAWEAAARGTDYSPAVLEEAQILRATTQGPVLADALRQAREIGGDRAADVVMRAAVGIERSIDPDVLEILERDLDGTLDPDLDARMREAWRWTQEGIIDPGEARRLEGAGRTRGPLSEEQLGDVPMPSAVERVLAPLREKREALTEELEGRTDPRTGEHVPGLRGRAAAARQAATERRQRAEDRGMVPPRALERVEATAERRGEAGALLGAGERLSARAGEPLPRVQTPDPQRVFEPVERGARREGVAEGVDRAGRDLRARGERMAEPTEAEIAAAIEPRQRKVEQGAARLAAAQEAAGTARERLASQPRLPEPTQVWWPRRAEGVQVVPEGSPVTAAERQSTQQAVNDLAAQAWAKLRTDQDIDIVGQESLPVIPTGARGGEWDWVEGLTREERAAYQAVAKEKAAGGEVSASSGPDHWQTQLGTGSIDEAAAIVMDRVKAVTALDQLARGFRPWFEEHLPLDLTPEETALMRALPTEAVKGYGIGSRARRQRGTFTPGRKSWKGGALDRVAEATRAERNALAEADAMGPDPGVGPWATMDEATWSAEVDRIADGLLEAQRQAGDQGEWGRTSAEVVRLERELEAIVPSAFFEDGADMATTYARLREQSARHHPGDVNYEAAAGVDAVATAESRAWEAWAADTDARELAREQGVRFEGRAAFADLSADERAIYGEIDQRSRQVGLQQALEEGRERAIASLRQRQPGRQVVKEGDRLTAQAERLRTQATEAADAGDGGLAARRMQVAQRLDAAGVRRGMAQGARQEAGRIAGDLADRGARIDRQLEPVVGPAKRDQAVAQLEDRLRRTTFRQGDYVGRVERDAQLAERMAAKKEQRLGRVEERLAAREAELAQGPPEVAPAKDRSVLLMSQRVKQALNKHADERTQDAAAEMGVVIDEWADDIAAVVDDPVAQQLVMLVDSLPDTLTALQGWLDSRGLDRPGYVPGAIDEPLSGGFVGGAKDRIPREALTSAEQAKRLGRAPKRTTTIARTYADEVGKLAENKAVEAMVQRGFAVPAQQVIEGLRLAVDENGQRLVPDDVIDDLLAGRTAERAYDIGSQLQRAGFTAWDPRSPTSGVPPSSINLGTMVVPTPVFNAFRRHFAADSQAKWLKVVDAPTRVWKHMVLALNPHWQIGNVVGNAMMASIAGGVPPHVLVREGWNAVKMLTEEGSAPKGVQRIVRALAKDLRDQRGQVLFPARLYDAGFSAEMLHQLASGAGEVGRVGKVLRASYNFNNFIDNWGRSTVYLAKKGKGLSNEQAVQAALRAMGDFSRMAPWERNVARRILPFYAFMRHVAQMTWRLPLHHPYRVAATLHIANLNAPELPEGTPAWLMGSIPLGGDRYLNTSSFNPFMGGFTPLSAGDANPIAEVARGVNPVAQFALAGGAGFNLRQFRMVSRPPGSGRHDAEGRPVAGPMAPSEALYWLSQQTPQSRLLGSVLGDNVVRYDQGDPMVAQGRRLEVDGPRSESIIRNLGLPWPVTVDTATRARLARQRRLANQRARERYARTAG